MAFFVYMLASQRNVTLYVGMTDDLVKRVWQHRNGIIPGFTKQYSIKMLVGYEAHESRESAFLRERQIKKWNRVWKLELIEKENSSWRDLGDEISMRTKVLDSRFRGNERMWMRCAFYSACPRGRGDPGLSHSSW
jgi:putative endonuclease